MIVYKDNSRELATFPHAFVNYYIESRKYDEKLCILLCFTRNMFGAVFYFIFLRKFHGKKTNSRFFLTVLIKVFRNYLNYSNSSKIRSPKTFLYNPSFRFRIILNSAQAHHKKEKTIGEFFLN